MTIRCVTPNPALDVTYRVNPVVVHAVNRVSEVTQRPGGKGVNVARLLAARGHDVAAYGFLGGATGQLLHDLLTQLQPSIQQRWTLTDVETRRTIAVTDAADTTMFNEPGHPVSAAAWADLATALVTDCQPGDVVTISGSLPVGATPEQVSRLVTGARERGAIVIVDTSGPGLLTAAAAGAHVLKPNKHELLEVTGANDTRSGIAALLHSGCQAVVASLGPDGLVLATQDRTTSAALGRTLTGNPTGAGDALVAALAAGLAAPSTDDLHDRLTGALPNAVAWSAAAVLSPVAGEIDQTLADQLAHDVTTKEI